MITRFTMAACLYLTWIGTCWSEDAIPFEQVIGKRDETGSVKIELDPVDEVLVFSGGNFVLWGGNLDIKAARVRIDTDTVIVAFPSGSVASNVPQSATGTTAKDGAMGAPGNVGSAAGKFTFDFGSIDGPGRLVVHNDGADGLIGGQGGDGGAGKPGKNGTDARCLCTPECMGKNCIKHTFELGEVTIENPEILKNYEVFLQLQERQKLAQAQMQKQAQLQAQVQNQAPDETQTDAQVQAQSLAQAETMAMVVAEEHANMLPLEFSPQGLKCDRTKGGSGGGPGGPGGNGGSGGLGGTGGAGGVVLYSKDFEQLVQAGQITLTASGGRPGSGGVGGALGKGGQGGGGGSEFCRSNRAHRDGPNGADGLPGDKGRDGATGPSGTCGLIGKEPRECASALMVIQ